jgi:NADH-quinone oxidoreductase subunit J
MASSLNPNLLLAIPLAPLAGAAIAGLFGTKFFGEKIGRTASHSVTILGVAIAFILSALVLVYVGAVMVLFLFVVMMIDIDIEHLRRDFWTYVPMGAFVGAIIIMEMAVVLTKTFMGRVQPVQELPKGFNGPNTQALGKLIYTDYIYAFEVAGAVLLLAIVAAVALTVRRRKDTKAQKPSEQIRVQRKDRVRLVSMPAEKAAGAASADSNG